MNTDQDFMRLALLEAQKAEKKGEVPVGAVIVKAGKVIAYGHNQPILKQDPTAHAEIIALQNAGKLLGNYRLPECDLYVTLEPCAMCVGAMLHARIKRVVFGAYDPKTGAAGSVINLFEKDDLNHHATVVGGVLKEDCAEILKSFFALRRKEAKSVKASKEKGT